MNLSRELDAGDIVVRRKRKRHLVSSAYNCCLICNDPAVDVEAPALSETQIFASSTRQDAAYTDTASAPLFHASPRRTSCDALDGSSNFQGLRSETYFSPAQDNLLGSVPAETTLPPDDGTGDLVTVDAFLKQSVRPTTQIPRKYKAQKLTNVDNNEDEIECLHLRSRRIQRTAPDYSTQISPDSSAHVTSRSMPKDCRRKSRKPKRNRLAEKLLTAVMMTSGEPNEDLLQSGADGRISLPMMAEPQSLTRSKPRKWCLVDPRKVTTPFRASVFRMAGEGRSMAETPTSYEQFAYERFRVAHESDNRGVDIEDCQGLQEPSSPCIVRARQRRAAGRGTVNFSEPSQSESRKRIKKPRAKARKANKKAPALSSPQLAISAGVESDSGRTPLDMVPVLIKSRTGY